MRHDYLYDYCKIDAYCKSEGLNTEYFITSKNRHDRHTKSNKALGWLIKGR